MTQTPTFKLMNPIAIDEEELTDEVFDQVVRTLAVENTDALRPVTRSVVEERFKPQIDQMVRSLQSDARFRRQLYEWAMKRAIEHLAQDPSLDERIKVIARSIVDAAVAETREELVKGLADKLRGVLR